MTKIQTGQKVTRQNISNWIVFSVLRSMTMADELVLMSSSIFEPTCTNCIVGSDALLSVRLHVCSPESILAYNPPRIINGRPLTLSPLINNGVTETGTIFSLFWVVRVSFLSLLQWLLNTVNTEEYAHLMSKHIMKVIW